MACWDLMLGSPDDFLSIGTVCCGIEGVSEGVHEVVTDMYDVYCEAEQADAGWEGFLGWLNEQEGWDVDLD